MRMENGVSEHALEMMEQEKNEDDNEELSEVNYMLYHYVYELIKCHSSWFKHSSLIFISATVWSVCLTLEILYSMHMCKYNIMYN